MTLGMIQRPLLSIVACPVLAVLLASGCDDTHGHGALDASATSDSATPGAPLPAVRLLVFSDPHYFDPSLGSTGQELANDMASEGKMVIESDAILRALVAAVEAENPQAILLPGDLTKDGELASHNAVASYLRRMQAGGRRVFVIPGNHDIENAGAFRYAGDVATPVPTISAAEFVSLYGDMGYDAALARDPASLSYVAEIVPGLRLLALDSCIYGDQAGSAVTAGRLTEPTRAWIDAQLSLAASQGTRVIAMMHHGLVEHFTDQSVAFGEYLVSDRDAVAALLSHGGVGAVFTGHFHANDVTQGRPSGSAKSIFDIETGSTVTFPSPYRLVDVLGDTLTITTKHVLAIDRDLEGGADFQSYAKARLRADVSRSLSHLLEEPPYSLSADTVTRISPWLADATVAHYAGDEVMPADVPGEVQSLLSSGSSVQMMAGMMLRSIWSDLPPADNDLVLNLADR